MKLFSKKNLRAGFTLIELLVIIAIIGVMAGAVVVAVNPLSKLNSAKLANVKTFSASVENALIMSQVGKWSFDEESGKAKDTSGYGNDGTLYGGATRQTSAQCGLGFGGCMSFDGDRDYIEVTDSKSINFSVGSFSIGVWIKSDYTYNGAGILSKAKPSSPVKYYEFWEPGTGVEAFIIFDGENRGRGYVTGKTKVYDNVWHYIVVVRDKSQNKLFLYVDGKLDAQANDQTIDVSTTGYPLEIGRRANWNGLMDEVQIYNKALLSYQIQQLYAQGLVKHLLALK